MFDVFPVSILNYQSNKTNSTRDLEVNKSFAFNRENYLYANHSERLTTLFILHRPIQCELHYFKMKWNTIEEKQQQQKKKTKQNEEEEERPNERTKIYRK